MAADSGLMRTDNMIRAHYETQLDSLITGLNLYEHNNRYNRCKAHGHSYIKEYMVNT